MVVLCFGCNDSCCVDEVAAEHVDADVVVHFGHSCLSRTSRLPALYVFGKYPLQVDSLVAYATEVAEQDSAPLHIIFDVRYQHHHGMSSQALCLCLCLCLYLPPARSFFVSPSPCDRCARCRCCGCCSQGAAERGRDSCRCRLLIRSTRRSHSTPKHASSKHTTRQQQQRP